MGIQSRLRHDATPYLSLIMVSVVVSRLLESFWPGVEVLHGQGAAIAFQLAVVPGILALWLLFRPAPSRRKYLNLVMCVLAANFLFLFALGAVRGESWSYIAAVLPISVGLIWIKPPSYNAIINSTNAFCAALISVGIIYQTSVYLGLVQDREYLAHRYFGFAATDFFYWRWEGPFGNVNLAGPVGAFLLVYGLTRSSWWRSVLVIWGAIFIIASESRGAIFAATVGVLTWVLCRERLAGWAWSVRSKAAIAAVVIVGLLSSVFLLDPTMNHRQEIWTDYLRLWIDSPWLGLEQMRLETALQSENVLLKGLTGESLYFKGMDGHSLYVDTLTRFGVAGLALTLSAIALVFVLSWKAYRKGMSTGLVIILAFAAGSASDVLTSWIYLSFLLLPLIIAALLSAAWLQECESRSRSVDPALSKQEPVVINA